MLKRMLSMSLPGVVLASASAGVGPLSVGELQHRLDKLDRLVSVMFIAAHPDDENTRLISWLANEAHAHTVYLSLTRGDGGQNVLGTDLGDKLGWIRTQELLAARRLDGGQQMFTRARDFGFSKTAEESVQIWGREEVLADMVWAIRLQRPDVLINRFGLEAGTTHGHHTASARLALEAFEAAGDPQQFPEQLEWVEPWQPKRLVWNTSRSFQRTDSATEELTTVNSGGYLPQLGTSHPEIAARSRSRHRTQAFGSTAQLGDAYDSFMHIAGEESGESLFSGIDMSWSRLKGGSEIAEKVAELKEIFDPREPWKSVELLVEIRRLAEGLEDNFWREKKLEELDVLIAGAIGLDLESVAAKAHGTAGENISLTVNAIQRSPLPVSLKEVRVPGEEKVVEAGSPMAVNELVRFAATARIGESATTSQPYWLMEDGTAGLYAVTDPQQIGSPESPPTLPVVAVLDIAGTIVEYPLVTVFKYNDRVFGETLEPFVVAPQVTVNLRESILISADHDEKEVEVFLKSWRDGVEGTLILEASDGWRLSQSSFPFVLEKSGDEQVLRLQVTPPEGSSEGLLQAKVRLADGTVLDYGYERIEYEHIPLLTLFPRAEMRLVQLEVEKRGERIGYIPGAGDLIPQALQRMGYEVVMLEEADLDAAKLTSFQAIVLGIRALNTQKRIGFWMPALLEYVQNGGTLVVQYSTTWDVQVEQFAPYPLQISRERVTEEDAGVRILAPEHPVMNYPNRIGEADFAGWVQERGLYFAGSWDEAYTAVLGCHDTGEPLREGGLLVSRHGEGWFVYTGYSWFRQLPAGVPGAYRIFANIVSLKGGE